MQLFAEPCKVYMDCAFAFLFRDVMEDGCGPIYLWCDSSPQVGVDWLLSIFDRIQEDQLQQCHQKYQLLYRSTCLIRKALEPSETHDGLDASLLAETALERTESVKFLKANIRRHRQMPIGLGSGATKLENKCQALALKFAHETHSFRTLRRVAEAVVSLTVDMGTESGVAEAHGGDVVSYLPPWVASQASLQEDVGLEAIETPSDHLFPLSMISAGLDHISNNLLSDMDKHLQCWSEWLPKFKAVAHLLSHRHLLNRLVGRCILNTPHQALARVFQTCVEPVAKWRWGTIVKTLPNILKVQRALGIVWDERKFVNRGEDVQSPGDDPFDCSLVTKTVQDPSWWATGHMLLQLHSIGNLASAWGSKCPCHEWVTEKSEAEALTEHVVMSGELDRMLDVLQVDKSLDGARLDCPLKGKRGPELAAGKLMPFINAEVEHCMGEVLVACATVSPAESERIVSDYTLGTNHIKMYLGIKVGYWESLPWLFAALALPEPEVEHKTIAEKALQQFSQFPAEPIHHHCLTWRIMSPKSTLRAQVEALAQGRELSSMLELSCEVARLAFIPVVERIVEGAHSLVHRHAGYRKVSGAYVSCSQRFPEMEAFLETPGGQARFVEAFERLRKPRKLANLFRFKEHPLWHELVSKPSKQQSGAQKLVNAIVYSTDPRTMYVDHKVTRKQHDKRQRQAMEAKLQLQPSAKTALTQDSIMQQALVKHVQERLRPGEFYSIPVDDGLGPDTVLLPVQSLANALAIPDGKIEKKKKKVENAFLKVVSVGSFRLKTVKSSRKRLRDGDIVVTMHESDPVIGERGFVDARPIQCSASGDTVHVLSASGVSPDRFSRIQCWKRQGQCQFTLPHFDNAVATQLLGRFFHGNALERSSSFLTIGESDANERQVLQDMCFEGWVIQSDEGWQLSKPALQQLRISQGVESPKSICDLVPGMPLKDQSTWEILQQLVHNGWTWKKLPPRKQGVSVQPYALGGPRFWYTERDVVRKEYVLCLLQSQELLQTNAAGEVRVVHHAMPIAYYQKLLEGDFEEAYMIADSKKAPAPSVDDQLRPMLADEGIVWETAAPAPALADQRPPKRRRTKKAPPSSDDSEALLAIDFDVSPVVGGEWVSDDEFGNELESDNDDLASGHQVPPGLAPEEEPPSLAASSSSAPVVDDSAAAAISRVVQPETLSSWGNGPQKFRITWRKPTQTCKYGAWQGLCPYHKKTETAKCTRSLNVADDSQESRDTALRMVKHWLICANRFDRAWKHAMFNPRGEETPSEQVLLTRSEDMLLPGDVRVDDDLDSTASKALAKRSKTKAASSKTKAAPSKTKAASSSLPPATSRASEAALDARIADDPANSQAESSSSLSSASSSSSSSSS